MTRVVSVTARGGFAEPPLAATVNVAVVALGVAGFAVLAVLLVGAATRSAFAEPRGPLTAQEVVVPALVETRDLFASTRPPTEASPRCRA